MVELYHLVRVTYISVGKLGDVYESVLMDSYVDKASKVGDVGDDTRKHHALDKVVDLFHVRVELELL